VASTPGGVQNGGASVYSPNFNGRRTASGRAFRQNENIAASKTLPLGSSARVTNLKTGQSAIVEVVDRGPYVRGRIIDLSPAAAEQLGMDRRGTAYVSVELVARP
jgi:rare lipoprotein A